ncbi:MAG: hypothetical protein K6A74_07350 [Lachnospiraceae bacterium]|nr:hypothetical protein [Lachnospiraceae bacterium]
MGKRLRIALITALAVMLIPMNVFAGDVNPYEAELCGIAGGTYEKDGYYWTLKIEYQQKGARYVARDDVDLTQVDAQNAAASFYASIGDPAYFDKVGEVEKPDAPANPNPQPAKPEVDNTDTNTDTNTEVQEPAEPATDDTTTTAKTNVKAVAEAEEVVRETKKETYSDGLTDIEFETPKQVEIDGKEVAIIKISEEAAAVGDPNGLSEMWEPARDYSNEEPMQKLPGIGIVVGIVVGAAVIVIAAILIAHRVNSRNSRFKH